MTNIENQVYFEKKTCPIFDPCISSKRTYFSIYFYNNVISSKKEDEHIFFIFSFQINKLWHLCTPNQTWWKNLLVSTVTFQKLAFLEDPCANTQALCRRAHGDIPEVFAFGIHVQLDAKPLRLSCLSKKIENSLNWCIYDLTLIAHFCTFYRTILRSSKP